MKILKYPERVKVERVTCRCGAELEYTDYDVKYHQMKCVTDRTWIVCPLCKHEITLSEKHINY